MSPLKPIKEWRSRVFVFALINQERLRAAAYRSISSESTMYRRPNPPRRFICWFADMQQQSALHVLGFLEIRDLAFVMCLGRKQLEIATDPGLPQWACFVCEHDNGARLRLPRFSTLLALRVVHTRHDKSLEDMADWTHLPRTLRTLRLEHDGPAEDGDETEAEAETETESTACEALAESAYAAGIARWIRQLLAQAPRLSSLVLSGYFFVDPSALFSPARQLRVLCLDRVVVTDDTLEAIAAHCAVLQRLAIANSCTGDHVDRQGFSEIGLQAITTQRAGLRALEVGGLGWHESEVGSINGLQIALSDSLLVGSVCAGSLVQLCVDGCQHLRDGFLAALPVHAPLLQELFVEGCYFSTQAVITAAQALPLRVLCCPCICGQFSVSSAALLAQALKHVRTVSFSVRRSECLPAGSAAHLGNDLGPLSPQTFRQEMSRDEALRAEAAAQFRAECQSTCDPIVVTVDIHHQAFEPHCGGRDGPRLLGSWTRGDAAPMRREWYGADGWAGQPMPVLSTPPPPVAPPPLPFEQLITTVTAATVVPGGGSERGG